MNHYLYYFITLGVYFCVYVLLGLGYNLQYGLAGIHNVANFIFVAFGSYIAATVSLGPSQQLVQHYLFGATLAWPLPLVMAAITGAVTSLVLGVVFLWHLKYQYQAIVTLVVAQVAWLLIGNATALFNGYNGLAGVPQPLEAHLNFGPVPYEAFFFGISLVFAALGLVFMRRIVRSPLGRALRAIREDEHVASAFGRNVFRSQMAAFVVSGAMAGLAGGLLVEYLGSWTPSGWTTSEGFVVIATLIIGGTANNAGSAIGAFVVPVAIYELTGFIPPFGPISSATIDAARWIAIGLLVLVFLWFRPQGVLPEPRRRFRFVDQILVSEAGRIAARVGEIGGATAEQLEPVPAGGEVQ